MDELNQMPNTSMPQMPPMAGGSSPVMGIPSRPMKKKIAWFWIIIAIILVIGGLAWWYVSQMAVEVPLVHQFQSDNDAREDALISRDIQETDTGNVDTEFQTVDKDLNSL